MLPLPRYCYPTTRSSIEIPAHSQGKLFGLHFHTKWCLLDRSCHFSNIQYYLKAECLVQTLNYQISTHMILVCSCVKTCQAVSGVWLCVTCLHYDHYDAAAAGGDQVPSDPPPAPQPGNIPHTKKIFSCMMPRCSEQLSATPALARGRENSWDGG